MTKKIRIVLVSIFLLITYNSLKARAWAGEDAFIFFRYVDNFLNGNGLVFNVGERVEGFTAPLWVFLLSFFRYFTKYELRPIAIVLGLLLSTVSIGILLWYDNKKTIFLPFGALLLITNSAFRDFSTSGFETSLTYLLLILTAVLYKKSYLERKPFVVGLLLSLLVLNRPESFLLFAYLNLIQIYKILNASLGSKREVLSVKNAVRKYFAFIFPFIVTVGCYQIFRMGYYASLLPNTFYAKKGGELYFKQGVNYLFDFVNSYKYSVILLAVILFLFICNLSKKYIYDEYSTNRIHMLIMSCLLLGYVLYAGGDYMHGRSLLMFFILFVASLNDFIDMLFIKLAEITKKRYNDSSSVLLAGITLLFITAVLLANQVPITVAKLKQINYIDDERHRFGNEFDQKYFMEYISIPITGELGWRDRGFYYKQVSEAVGMPVSVLMLNIGFFGYAGGPDVSIEGATLIDPYISRTPIPSRSKIRHENGQYIEYVLYKKPTFAYTPFKQWNDPAHFKLTSVPYSAVITDDSNDSYVPLFDLSDEIFIKKYSQLVGKDIHKNIDTAQIEFISNLNKSNLESYDMDVMDYLSFLSVHWYPYTNPQNREIFDQKRRELSDGPITPGRWEVFNTTVKPEIDELYEHISGDLSSEKFIGNIRYAFSNSK